MAEEFTSRKEQQKKLLAAALFRHRNLCILSTGIVTGILVSPLLLPIGLIVYGFVCYLDLHSTEFVRKVLFGETGGKASAAEAPPRTTPLRAVRIAIPELQALQARIAAAQKKIQQLYDQADAFTHDLWGDFAQIETLVKKSQELLAKAQQIRNYLASEQPAQMQQEMTALAEKIRQGRDAFAKRQYEQALAARRQHLDSLADVQQMYERFVAQLTNIASSLDSLYAQIMKLKTSEYALASAESEQVAAQLAQIFAEAEQLDAALKQKLELPGNATKT